MFREEGGSSGLLPVANLAKEEIWEHSDFFCEAR